jgi:uncharacterized glyoxalase superfamily protein PhnB
MNPPPKGWPRLSLAVYYDDAAAAIDWLCKAFDFEIQLRVDGEGGRVEHAELTYGGALVMISSIKGDAPHDQDFVSPQAIGGKNTHGPCLYVDDADAHYLRAKAAGATIGIAPETHDYGDDYWADRGYQAIDPEGHRWWFMQRLTRSNETSV